MNYSESTIYASLDQDLNLCYVTYEGIPYTTRWAIEVKKYSDFVGKLSDDAPWQQIYY